MPNAAALNVQAANRIRRNNKGPQLRLRVCHTQMKLSQRQRATLFARRALRFLTVVYKGIFDIEPLRQCGIRVRPDSEEMLLAADLFRTIARSGERTAGSLCVAPRACYAAVLQ